MSLWLCKTHGFTGPRGCCADAERAHYDLTLPGATLSYTPQLLGWQDDPPRHTPETPVVGTLPRPQGGTP